MTIKGFSFVSIVTFLIIGLIAIPLIIVSLALESTPLVVQGEKLTVDDMERIKEILEKNNPRKLRIGEIKSITLTERDLNLFLIHALTYFPHHEKYSGSMLLKPNSAKGCLTVTLPKSPFGTYLNISTGFSTQSKAVALDSVHIGALKLPKWLIEKMGHYCHEYLLRRQDYRELIEGIGYVKNVEVDENELLLAYQWEPEVVDRLQVHGSGLLLPDQERERLIAYYCELRTIASTVNKRLISLVEILQPLAEFALERSKVNDPIGENRALITVMALHLMRKNLFNIVGSNGVEDIRPARRLRLTLLGRRDLAQHFIISAAIAASANSNTASVIGLFKEIDDSRGGSGFSFADLAADRAGVKWAEVATSIPSQAKLLLQQMKESLTENDLMPPIENLPEGIMEHEFKKEYGDIESEMFQLVDKEIEDRISSCRLYQ